MTYSNPSNNLATFLQQTGNTIYLKMSWQIMMIMSTHSQGKNCHYIIWWWKLFKNNMFKYTFHQKFLRLLQFWWWWSTESDMAASCRDLQLRSTIQGCQHKLLSSFFLICRAVALLELEEKKEDTSEKWCRHFCKVDSAYGHCLPSTQYIAINIASWNMLTKIL